MTEPTWTDIASAWSNTLNTIGDLATTPELEVTPLGREIFEMYLEANK